VSRVGARCQTEPNEQWLWGSRLRCRWPLGRVCEWTPPKSEAGLALTCAVSGADVEDTTGLLLVDGRCIVTSDKPCHDIVEEDKAVHFLLVIWPRVPCLSHNLGLESMFNKIPTSRRYKRDTRPGTYCPLEKRDIDGHVHRGSRPHSRLWMSRSSSVRYFMTQPC
jgi:hypothetical protein